MGIAKTLQLEEFHNRPCSECGGYEIRTPDGQRDIVHDDGCLDMIAELYGDDDTQPDYEEFDNYDDDPDPDP
jgi:hypothetical protein